MRFDSPHSVGYLAQDVSLRYGEPCFGSTTRHEEMLRQRSLYGKTRLAHPLKTVFEHFRVFEWQDASSSLD